MVASSGPKGAVTPDPVVAELGRRARARRTELGLSQEQVAHRAGMHLTFVSRVERAEREMRVTNLVRLASALDMDAGDLVAGLGPSPPVPRRPS